VSNKNEKAISDLLKTTDKQEQINRIETLIQIANSPVHNILITFDTRTGSVNVLYPKIGFESVHVILDKARAMLIKEELRQNNETPETPTLPEL
jgi:hypothetical protein